ncbi:MAG: hypothetical protein O9262_03620, partial [Cyclobacteriaceae bacterium]|nr:hypothetical protein [Cyclobacteriaceae bacterium]
MQTETDTVIEIFKTSINSQQAATLVKYVLSDKYPDAKINFDLEDCDRILRIENKVICVEEVTAIVNTLGH